MTRDVYQEVTDQIVEAIESGCAPWSRPWRAGIGGGLPYNLKSQKAYRGINVLLLWSAGAAFQSQAWLTFKQAKERGGNVRKGEKGTRIVFFKMLERADRDDDSRTVRIPLARYYTVFNAEQCEGIDADEPETESTPIERHAAVDAFVTAQGADIRYGGDRACYVPSQDCIRMPEPERFHSADGYYGTLLHELTHWTSPSSRCDRDLSGRFGDEQYAAEELVAELGAAFLCAACGVDGADGRQGIQQHASYIESWLKVLKGDKRAIFTAASKATQAVEWLTANEEQEAMAA